MTTRASHRQIGVVASGLQVTASGLQVTPGAFRSPTVPHCIQIALALNEAARLAVTHGRDRFSEDPATPLLVFSLPLVIGHLHILS